MARKGLTPRKTTRSTAQAQAPTTASTAINENPVTQTHRPQPSVQNISGLRNENLDFLDPVLRDSIGNNHTAAMNAIMEHVQALRQIAQRASVPLPAPEPVPAPESVLAPTPLPVSVPTATPTTAPIPTPGLLSALTPPATAETTPQAMPIASSMPAISDAIGSVPKPQGSAGGGRRGYHLQSEMGLDGHDGTKKYCMILATVRELVHAARIDLSKPYRYVRAEDLSRVLSAARRIHPYLARFQRDWATAAMVKQYMSSARRYGKRRGYFNEQGGNENMHHVPI